MALDPTYITRTIARQARFFRVLRDPRRGGETFNSIHLATGISESALRQYAGTHGAPSVMSLACFQAFRDAYPEWIGILDPQEDE